MGLIDEFDRQVGEWLLGNGPEADIVISTRVRLARNVVDFPFLTKATERQRSGLEKVLRERITQAGIQESDGERGGIVYASMEETDALERLCLVERHLISRDLASGDGGGVALDSRESVSIMVNEEDHLRIQVLRSGLQPEAAWNQASAIDDRLEELLNYAFHADFGYLTACPTNCGTGLRISVMLHLPALVMTKQIDKVFQAVGKMNLAVRGLYGEGTQAFGDFYQISNQVTLGRSEQDILQQVHDVVPQIVKYERAIRDTLVAENRNMLEDRVWRAYGMLRNARTITSEETMDLLSAIRMGVNLRLIDSVPIDAVNELFMRTQPAHLQRLEGRLLEAADRDVARAAYIRMRLDELN
ncbi:protein arginine kinase [Planctomycetota bacterium]